ncbi:MAG: hypothetical protein WEE89_17110 [Gemmatimonadota bacterium]
MVREPKRSTVRKDTAGRSQRDDDRNDPDVVWWEADPETFQFSYVSPSAESCSGSRWRIG